MSYAGDDRSVHGGRPIELYKFESDSDRWLLTSADFDQTYNSNAFDGDNVLRTYTSIPIKRSGLVSMADGQGEEFQVELPSHLPSGAINPLIQRYAILLVPGRLRLQMFRRHGEDGEVERVWKGRVTEFMPAGRGLRIARSPSLLADAMEARFPRVRNTPTCVHEHGGTECGVNLSSFTEVQEVVSIDGLEVTLDGDGGQADGYFDLGILRRTATGEQAMIKMGGHVGNVVTLRNLIPDLAATDEVELIAGCDRLPTTCDDKYSNHVNFFGTAVHVTGEDPFRYDIR